MQLNMGKSRDALLRCLGAWSQKWSSSAFKGIELGVHKGETSEALLHHFKGLHLTMVDSWAKHFPRDAYYQSGDGCSRLNVIEQEECRQEAIRRTEFAHDRRRILQMTTPEAARVVTGLFDVIFVDADHTYEAVKKDLSLYFPKLASWGLMCGDDYGHPRDQRGLWGVQKAVDEFAVHRNLDVRQDGNFWWFENFLTGKLREADDDDA